MIPFIREGEGDWLVSSERSLNGNKELQNTVSNVSVPSIELIGVIDVLEVESVVGVLE